MIHAWVSDPGYRSIRELRQPELRLLSPGHYLSLMPPRWAQRQLPMLLLDG